MWEKPYPLKCTGNARPLRVAYFIDPDDCADVQLDAIFAEAYGRWGGRRTLIVPSRPNGIDARYAEWLRYYDPDVICSFVPLQDSLIAELHEKYCPAHLVYRKPIHSPEEHYRIELPIQGLSSLSVVPVLLTRSFGIGERLSNLRVIDKFCEQNEAPLLQENFGFVSASYQPIVARVHANLFGTLTLISNDALNNSFLGKTPRSDHVTTEYSIWEELGKPSEILTLSIASDLFAPHLSAGYDKWSEGFSLVVGDSINDRLLFWNQHHRQETQWMGAISALRLPASRFDDPDFVSLIRKIVRQRGRRTSNGSTDIIIRSCSLSQRDLELIAQKLKSPDFFAPISCVHHEDHAACIPSFNPEHPPRYWHGGFGSQLDASETTEFREDYAYVPNALPWHVREAPPPEGLRAGSWMIDLSLDRLNDHCKFVNVRHEWILPRRLRLERAFKVTWPDRGPAHYGDNVKRVNRWGGLSIPRSLDQRSATIKIPEDLDAFLAGLCAQDEWGPFDRNRTDEPRKRERYSYATLSDKGRYLIAVLEHFELLPEAFDVFMNNFWRDVLIRLGAAPVEKNPDLRDEFLRTLRKGLGRPKGPLEFKDEADFDKLARASIRFGRKVGNTERIVEYSKLRTNWTDEVEKTLRDESHLSEEDKAHYLDPSSRLDPSIQHLCRRKLLFQGREWPCRSCHNRNWIAIDDMGSVLECQVCKATESAPVSGEWHFRANSFILEAYREHGVEAVIWTLWQLADRARSSFYFAPSIRLWELYPEQQDGPTLEVDALAVVDGSLYLCEAKSSPGLSKPQIEKLLAAAIRIRPNVVLISCMETPTSGMRNVVTELQATLGSDIAVELVEFNRESLEDATLLPT